MKCVFDGPGSRQVLSKDVGQSVSFFQDEPPEQVDQYSTEQKEMMQKLYMQVMESGGGLMDIDKGDELRNLFDTGDELRKLLSKGELELPKKDIQKALASGEDNSKCIQEGYSEGYSKEYSEALWKGYSKGYSEGYSEGYSKALWKGYSEGYSEAASKGIVHHSPDKSFQAFMNCPANLQKLYGYPLSSWVRMLIALLLSLADGTAARILVQGRRFLSSESILRT